jgi:hypothetical protein
VPRASDLWHLYTMLNIVGFRSRDAKASRFKVSVSSSLLALPYAQHFEVADVLICLRSPGNHRIGMILSPGP